MTKTEAILALKEGKRLTHEHFTQEEWVKMGNEGQMILEDGVEITPDEFWRWRQNESWNTGWEIIN